MLWAHSISFASGTQYLLCEGFWEATTLKTRLHLRCPEEKSLLWLTVHFVIPFLIQFNFLHDFRSYRADIYTSVTMHLLRLESKATLLLFSYSSLLKRWFVTPVPNSCSYRLRCGGLQKHAWLPKLGSMATTKSVINSLEFKVQTAPRQRYTFNNFHTTFE